MAILKLWQPLLQLLEDEHQPVVAHACWIMGTAVQNNLKAQAAVSLPLLFLNFNPPFLDPPLPQPASPSTPLSSTLFYAAANTQLYVFNALPAILSTIYPSAESSSKPYTSTRAKATYALSSALKHWPLAAAALASNDSQGHTVLARGVVDPEPVIRRKMAFLIGTLTMQSDEKYEGEIPGEVINLVEEHTKSGGRSEDLVSALKREGVYSALVKGLKESSDDIEFEENALRALAKAAEKDGLTHEEKHDVKTLWHSWGPQGQEERGLQGEDASHIHKVFA